jgi:outer membrane protein OmpA-like peptidoglycan-associated protein
VLAAHADAQKKVDDGFALNRYDPPERGSDWLVGESLDIRGNVRGGWGIVGDYGYRPLVLYQDGKKSVPIIEHQLFVHLGGTFVLFDRLRLGLNWPMLLISAGDDAMVGKTLVTSRRGSITGDLRLGADIRLLGEYRDVFSLAIGAKLNLPAGNVKGYTSDGKIRFEPRIMGAGEIGPFVYAARLSFNYRALTGTVTGEPFGSEIGFSASAGARMLDKKLVVGPELYGATVVQKKSAIFGRHTTPLEAILSAKYHLTKDLMAGLGVGTAPARAYGTPALRVLASFEWFPEPEPQKEAEPIQAVKDRDNDGIEDRDDACPNEPGDLADDPDANGCPTPKDRDSDGIVDNLDACPDQAGIRSADPKKNGCPELQDRDGDGIADQQDACIEEAGVASDNPSTNGCPAPKDQDGDGILNDKDACPEVPGVKNNDPKKNGCPVAAITGEQIVVNERIEFDEGEATLSGESEVILASVLAVLHGHPEITKLSVEGHTDNRGTRKANGMLSKRRAAAVVNWLIGHGVDKGRLVSTGYGPEKPIDSNETQTGRENNRRVEFRIVK